LEEFTLTTAKYAEEVLLFIPPTVKKVYIPGDADINAKVLKRFENIEYFD
jgi:hypothetical protein